MTYHDLSQREVPWHALLNCPEAGILGAREERELLVELVDCRNRILAAAPVDHSEAPRDEFPATSPRARSGPEGLDPARTPQDGRKRYQQIRSKLALANVRLVAHVAKPYHGRGIPPADLIQDGICSLLAAIDRFDIVNQTRLATYAIWWIRQGIQRAIAAGAYPVRLNPRQLYRLAQHGQNEGDEEWLRRGGAKRSRSDLAEGRHPRRRAAAGGHAADALARRTQPV